MFDPLKKLISSPMALFVYGILSKWYIMVSMAVLVVTFWVFKGLSDAGVIQMAEVAISKSLNETKAVARYCVPKILNLNSFWECLQNPPEHISTEEEQQLEKQSLRDLQKHQQAPLNKDPYG